MAYADYAYYAAFYASGTLAEPDFNRLAQRASAYLDAVTFGRATTLCADVRVKNACCAVADALYLNEHGGGIASETNDGVTVNYVAGVSKTKTDDQRLYEAAALYLANTGLLYRGV